MNVVESIKRDKLRIAFTIIILLLVIFIASTGVFVLVEKQKIATIINSSSNKVVQTSVITKEVYVNETLTVDIPIDSFLDPINNLPEFMSFSSDGKLVVRPQKLDNGEYFIKFNILNGSQVYSIKVKNQSVDLESMKDELVEYLNSKGILDKYGIYVKDLGRNLVTEINGETDFPPASMAKLTMAILVLRDIDAGKYTLETTYPLQADQIFNPEDDLGKLGAGTPVKIRTYLERLIEDSNNTAWYHLDKFLGGSYEVVDPRTVDELGVNVFLNPHKGTASEMGKLLDDLYNARTVSISSRDYLIDLMENALEWNREGIGQGLPSDIEFANKIGNLWTEQDINFCDSAIVFGRNTDYVLIIMNKDIDWESGKQNLKALSSIVYKYMDK